MQIKDPNQQNPDDVMPESTDDLPENEGDMSTGTADSQPQQDPDQAILDQIDDDELANYIIQLLRNDINDKEQTGWVSMRLYDINSYEGNRKPTNFPWYGASNFAVPLTATLLDTLHDNVMGSIFADPENTTDVQGVGVEDIRIAPMVAQLLNWQTNTELEAYEVWDVAVFRALLNGTSVIKVIQDFFENKVVLSCSPIENIYLPLDARGFQVHETDHVFEVIPLNYNDIQQRKGIMDQKTGQPVYEGLDEIRPGLKITPSTSLDSLTKAKDFIAGTKLSDRQYRDLYYLMECYLTYPKPANEKDVVELIELIVTIAPNGRRIIRKVINKTKLRPYVDLTPFPRDDRFFGRSMPERVRQIQEELDYSHNQNINAADIVISPPAFYDPASLQFNPNETYIVPGGYYPASGGKVPTYFQRDLNAVFERQEDRYWDFAERLTSVTELFQGRAPSKTKTLGEAKLRNNRAEIRFKSIYQRFEKAWSKMIRLVYLLDVDWMPRDKKIRVIGVADFKTIEELFPQGLEGQFNFTFRNAPITEVELKKQQRVELCEELLKTPIVEQDKGNLWRVLKYLAEAKGERDLETIVTKPQEANILSPEEMIQRIMSGQLDIVPEPGIDAQNAMLRLQLFMMNDTFKNSKPQQKQAFAKLLHRIQMIAVGQLQGRIHGMQIKQGPGQPGMPGQPGQPAPGGPQQPPQQNGAMNAKH